MDSLWQGHHNSGVFQLPESPHSPPSPLVSEGGINVTNATMESISDTTEDSGTTKFSISLSGNTFSFASSATSQLVLERIMSQS
nr:hypothetical protein [Tanacetum cinerariifolium]